MEDLPQAVKSK